MALAQNPVRHVSSLLPPTQSLPTRPSQRSAGYCRSPESWQWPLPLPVPQSYRARKCATKLMAKEAATAVMPPEKKNGMIGTKAPIAVEMADDVAAVH